MVGGVIDLGIWWYLKNEWSRLLDAVREETLLGSWISCPGRKKVRLWWYQVIWVAGGVSDVRGKRDSRGTHTEGSNMDPRSHSSSDKARQKQKLTLNYIKLTLNIEWWTSKCTHTCMYNNNHMNNCLITWSPHEQANMITKLNTQIWPQLHKMKEEISMNRKECTLPETAHRALQSTD